MITRTIVLSGTHAEQAEQLADAVVECGFEFRGRKHRGMPEKERLREELLQMSIELKEVRKEAQDFRDVQYRNFQHDPDQSFYTTHTFSWEEK